MRSIMDKFKLNSDLGLVIGLMTILTVMLVPIPRFLLDVLIATSIGISLLLLLTTLYTNKTMEFSVFPSVLLITTLYRLSLNVATTRVILLHGAQEGSSAAGEVIRSFGEFVVGGNYAVGFVIFLILAVINFVVITKGAGRVAEVAARFTLDALPGKQMAVDADLSHGIFSQDEARLRRGEIAREADFYGAMDGASKFVRGDAIASLIIVFFNLLGGFLIGVFDHGMSVSDAAHTFALLTIGDGLVSQIPALIISIAAGMMVTRTSSGDQYSKEVSKQLFMKPRALIATGGVMCFVALLPGLPFFVFMVLGAGLLGVSYYLIKKEKDEQLIELAREKFDDCKQRMSQEQQVVQSGFENASTESLDALLPLDVLELEIGYGLIRLVDHDQGGELLDLISQIRKKIALELGLVIPSLKIRDNLELKSGEYRIFLKGVEIGSGIMLVGKYLAINPGNVTQPLIEQPTREPAFGFEAVWITATQKEDAIRRGYTVVDVPVVVTTHLAELIRSHAHELIGRQELQYLLDSCRRTAPRVVDDLIPQLLPAGTVLRVLRQLLKEGVSIRDLKSILEALADAALTQKDPIILTECVRTILARAITRDLIDSDGQLKLVTLDRRIEQIIADGIIKTEFGQKLSLDPEFVKSLMRHLGQHVGEFTQKSEQPVVLCSPEIRFHLKTLVDRFIPSVVVLSHNEIMPNVHVRTFGTVRMEHAN